MYRVDKIRERVDPWPISILTLKKYETKFSYEYCVFLPTK